MKTRILGAISAFGALLGAAAQPAAAQTTVNYSLEDAVTVASAASYLDMTEQEFVDGSVEVHFFLLAISGKTGTRNCTIDIGSLPSGDYRYDVALSGRAIISVADHYCWSHREATYASVALLTFLTSLSASQSGQVIPTVQPAAQAPPGSIAEEIIEHLEGEEPVVGAATDASIRNLRVEDITTDRATLRWETTGCTGATMSLSNGGGVWSDGLPDEQQCWTNHFIKLGQAPFNSATTLAAGSVYVATVTSHGPNGESDTQSVTFQTDSISDRANSFHDGCARQINPQTNRAEGGQLPVHPNPNFVSSHGEGLSLVLTGPQALYQIHEVLADGRAFGALPLDGDHDVCYYPGMEHDFCWHIHGEGTAQVHSEMEQIPDRGYFTSIRRFSCTAAGIPDGSCVTSIFWGYFGDITRNTLCEEMDPFTQLHPCTWRFPNTNAFEFGPHPWGPDGLSWFCIAA